MNKKRNDEREIIAEEFYKFVERVRDKCKDVEDDYTAYLVLNMCLPIIMANKGKHVLKTVVWECLDKTLEQYEIEGCPVCRIGHK